MTITDNLSAIKSELPLSVTLVAVSKMHPIEAISEAYAAGQRVFGESRPQEMTAKQQQLPNDIAWHQIGHLQTNKVRMIAPYVALIHSVDSINLLETIDKEARKCGRVIDVLLEVRIAQEETKSGWNESDLIRYLDSGAFRSLTGVAFRGVMGIATYTDNEAQVRTEFEHLSALKERLRNEYFDACFDTLSIGMSGDYPLAISCGSNMVRVGSAIFGNRTY